MGAPCDLCRGVPFDFYDISVRGQIKGGYGRILLALLLKAFLHEYELPTKRRLKKMLEN